MIYGIVYRKKRRRIANYEGKHDERCRYDRNRKISRAKKGRKCDTGDRKPDRNPMTRQTVGRNAEREWQPSKERINEKYRQLMEMDNGVQAENSFAV